VGVLGGCVFAVGGYDGNSRHCLSSVEVYSPEAGAWAPAADMSARRSGAGVGVLGGLLYAVGGHDGPLVRRSVEAYSAERDEWRPVAEMNHSRRNAGVVAHAGKLYVVGGDDGTSNLPVRAIPPFKCWLTLTLSLSYSPWRSTIHAPTPGRC